MNHYRKFSLPSIALLGFLFCLLLITSPANGQSTHPYALDWWTVNGGGGSSSNDQYSLSGGAGQADASAVVVDPEQQYGISGGFWQGSNDPNTGQVTIIKLIDWKQEVTIAPSVEFEFSVDEDSFTLPDGGSFTFKLPAGDHEIVETYKYNWGIADIQCDGGHSERIVRGVHLTVEAEDEIVCTFVNTPRCVNPRADLSAVITWDEDGATAEVTNTSDALCTWEVGVASYKKYNENIDDQVIFDWLDGQSVDPNETITMTIDKPQCAVQVDAFLGEVLISLNGQRYGNRLLAWQHLNEDGYCE